VEGMLVILINLRYSKLQSNNNGKLMAEVFNHAKLKQAHISVAP